MLIDYGDITTPLLPAPEDRLPKKLHEDASHRPNADGDRLNVPENDHRDIVV